MAYLIYDGTFEGFLTVVFECYRQKISPQGIHKDQHFQHILFAEKQTIPTNEGHAHRVWTAMQKKLHSRNKNLPYLAFLSEEEGIEMKLYYFLKRLFDEQKRIETDYGDEQVLKLKKIERQVLKESSRLLQFIRFQKTKASIYFAPTEPQYDVLPLTIKHFKNRFADQKWLIYDLKRDYGFFYDLKVVEQVKFTEKNFSHADGQIAGNLLEEGEVAYQSLWKNYFESINIKERKNLKLQRQHMPQRYWKFLPEKSPGR